MLNALASALYSRLQGTALTSLLAGTTSIYHMQAPEGAALPYVIFNLQGGGDENLDKNRTKNLIVFVRGYSESTPAQAGSIDAQIDGLLHLTPLTVSGWTNIWLARETDLETVETEPNSQPIYMQGGFYRVHLDET